MHSKSPSSPPRLPFGPVHSCWVCGASIEPLQAVGQGGVCSRLECRAEGLRRQRRDEARVEAQRREAAREGLRRAGVDPGRASWSLTPSNPARPVPLGSDLRDEFVRHLRRVLVESELPGPGHPFPIVGHDAEEDEGVFPPPDTAERAALGVGCATCRGWCCRRGGTHAFLEAARIRRLRDERPELSDSDIVDLYASHLGSHHLEGGCVFQGETGCTLPRDLRGDTCNRYHCPDLAQARREFRRANRGGEHHFVAIGHPGHSTPRVATTKCPDPKLP